MRVASEHGRWRPAATTVTVAGAAVAAWASYALGTQAQAALPWPLLAGTALAFVTARPLVVGSERVGRRVLGAPAADALTLALLVVYGVPAAVVVRALTSLVAGLRAERAVAANVASAGRYALATAAAGLLLLAAGRGGSLARPYRLASADLAWMLPAMLVFFAVATLLGALLAGQAQRRPWRSALGQALPIEAVVAASLYPLAPAFAVLLTGAPAFLPLLVVPLGAAHRLADVAARRERHALTDPLTGAGNRSLWDLRARRVLSRRRGVTGVLLVDLDGFKALNDRYGHAAGDALLVEVARRLDAAVRAVDTVARVGGDEFAVLLENLGSAEVAEGLAERVAAALAAPVVVGGHRTRAAGSVGLAVAPDDGTDVADLLAAADAAMYAAKATGSGWARAGAGLPAPSPAEAAAVAARSS